MIESFEQCKTKKEIHKILSEIKAKISNKYFLIDNTTIKQAADDNIITKEMSNDIIEAYNQSYSWDLNKLTTIISNKHNLHHKLKTSDDITNKEKQFMLNQAKKYNLSLSSIKSMNHNINLIKKLGLAVNKELIGISSKCDYCILVFYLNNNREMFKKSFKFNYNQMKLIKKYMNTSTAYYLKNTSFDQFVADKILNAFLKDGTLDEIL